MGRTGATRRFSVLDGPYTLKFPGQNGKHMDVGNDIYIPEYTVPWTVFMTVNLISYPIIGHIFSEYMSSGSFRGRIIRTENGILKVMLIRTNGSNECVAQYNAPAIGRFVNVVISYNGNGNTSGITVYYDGVAQTAKTTTNTLSGSIIPTSTVATRWGAWGGSGSNQGMYITRFGIANYVFSSTNVNDLRYANYFSGGAPLDYYATTEGSGTSVASTGTAAHNATIVISGSGVTWDSTILPSKKRSTISQQRLIVS